MRAADERITAPWWWRAVESHLAHAIERLASEQGRSPGGPLAHLALEHLGVVARDGKLPRLPRQTRSRTAAGTSWRDVFARSTLGREFAFVRGTHRPAQATAPALVIVGFYMMSVVRDISWDDYDEAIPACVVMLVMPFTWSITNGRSVRPLFPAAAAGAPAGVRASGLARRVEALRRSVAS